MMRQDRSRVSLTLNPGYDRFGAPVLEMAQAIVEKFVEQATRLYERGMRMIPKKPAPGSIGGGNRFPAFAKPASAGEARSEKIMRQ